MGEFFKTPKNLQQKSWNLDPSQTPVPWECGKSAECHGCVGAAGTAHGRRRTPRHTPRTDGHARTRTRTPPRTAPMTTAHGCGYGAAGVTGDTSIADREDTAPDVV